MCECMSLLKGTVNPSTTQKKTNVTAMNDNIIMICIAFAVSL